MAESTKKDLIVRSKRPNSAGHLCCVDDCNSRAGVDRSLGVQRSYFRLPADPLLRTKWLKAIPRRRSNHDRVASAWDRVCSDHFPDGKRTYTPGTSGYIPSLFPSKPSPNARTTKSSAKAGSIPPLDFHSTPRKRLNTSTCSMPKVKSDEEDNSKSVWNTTDHDYIHTRVDETVYPLDYIELQQNIIRLEEENAILKRRVLSLDNIRDKDEDFRFWTNMPNYAVFISLSDYLEKRSSGQLKYWNGSRTEQYKHFSETKSSKPGKERKLSFKEEFFLVLVKLKTGKLNKDMALTFGVSESYISKSMSTWVNFLAQELKTLFEMKSDADVENMPECFRNISSLRIVLDCTELILERSSTLQARKETYSNYKARDTVKFLVGLSPNLTINYVSEAHGGRATDNHITMSSQELLDGLQPGSKVMADRGFTLNKELNDLGVELIIPNFKGRSRSQMSQAECIGSAKIAEVRIHVERIIQRIRTYHIWDSTVKLSMKDVINQYFIVCAYLSNFQLPIIHKL
ncbi:uncharacterized protein LOC135499803 [Lineus longissimus]|uniref:uncharacterized protein LOC135499803 n=1 Tax=Lineus longissimus TaxID=88925 RepID=UPI00315DCC99